MSGIPYPPPQHILSVFNKEEFIGDEGSLDVASASAYFVRYPTEIRPITLADVTATGTATLSGVTNITNATASTSTTTGALVVTGGVGVSGSANVGGTLTASTIQSTTNGFYTYDGANEGRIYQSSTDMILSSSGNKVTLTSGNNLIFKNDETTQTTAYIAREVVDDCEAHTFMYNAVNATKRYFLSSTFAINQSVPTNNYTTAVNRIYLFPVRLIKGQVVNGAGFYLSVVGTCTGSFSLYNSANPAVLLASSAVTSLAAGTNMYYLGFSVAYTIPTTGVYFVGFNPATIGTSINMVAVAANAYLSYGQSTMTSGVLNKAAQYVTSTGNPSTLSGLTPVIQDRIGYAVVWSNNAT